MLNQTCILADAAQGRADSFFVKHLLHNRNLVRIYARVRTGLSLVLNNMVNRQFECYPSQRSGIRRIAIDHCLRNGIRAVHIGRPQQYNYIFAAISVRNFFDFSLIIQINRACGCSNKTACDGIHRSRSGGLRHSRNRGTLNCIPFSESDYVFTF
jgi:hypothetical protein